MNYIGAVFFDFDGTLVDGREGILKPTDKTIEAIGLLRKNRYLTGLATGRAKCYIPRSAFLFDCYVTSNGAYAEVEGEAINNNIINTDELLRLTDYLDKIGMNYVMENQDCCYVKDMDEPFYLDMMRNFNMSNENYYPLTDHSAFSQQINKLMVTYDDAAKLKQFRQEFGDNYDITGQPGNQACDVGKKGITKAFGIKKVIEYLKLDKDQTFAFGDADNDYDMFRTVGYGIAMARHTSKLEETASYVTKSVKEDGIFHALKHLGMI